MRLLFTMLVAALMAGTAGAQTLYRCGNTYSQTPCAADAASARLSANAAPDVAAGSGGQELCASEGVAQLGFPDPESTRVRSITRAGTEVIQYAGKALAARRYNMVLNTKNSSGAYTGERSYHCYLSEDERRVLKVGSR
ncbi:MAG: hypothetical protein ABW190_04115 [Rhizobacter sp.]